MRRWILPLLAVLMLAMPAGAAAPCPIDGYCEVAEGRYMAVPPPGWDGISPLPVVVHFHGFRESAADLSARDDLKGAAARIGHLLVLPDGAGQSWSHPGSPSQRRDEFAFVEALLADLKARYPIAIVWASGFSQGASMVWNLACHRGHLFAAYLPIAGAFWRPEPEACPSYPVPIRHIKCLSDRTVPLEGRTIRGGAFHQGDALRAAGMARRAAGCDPVGARSVRDGALVCQRETACRAGAAFEFCLHTNGHDFDPGWLAGGWEFVRRSQAR